MIIPAMLKRNTIGFMKLIGFTLLNVVFFKQSWRFVPAQLMYLHKRNMYDLKLYTDENFRKLVEIDNWLEYKHEVDQVYN
jgi:glucosyl-dolichyl phosphate glucuronosyltransferase